MYTPFRRFLAALSLAVPGVAFAQGPAPIVPELPKVTKAAQTQAPATPAPAPVTPVAPSMAQVAAACPTEAAPEYKLVADRFWIGADFFLAARKGTDVPALITTSPVPPAAVAGFPGALGRPDTSVVFGQRRYNNDRFGPGMHVNAGLFLDDAKTWSVDGTMVGLLEAKENFAIATTPTQSVFAPVAINFPGAGPGGLPVGFPTLPLSSATAQVSNSFIGADTNVRYGLVSSETSRLDVFVGYRYLNLRETVSLNTAIDIDAFFGIPPVFFGTALTNDTFKTRNNFHGVNLGASGSRRIGERFSVSAKGAIALGNTTSTTEIFGSNNYTGGILGGILPPTGGIYAQATNSGTFTSSQFAVVPEANVALAYDFSDRFRTSLGYSFLYWSKVKRAGDQIDTTQTSAFGFPASGGRPVFPNTDGDFWVQGVTFGFELKY